MILPPTSVIHTLITFHSDDAVTFLPHPAPLPSSSHRNAYLTPWLPAASLAWITRSTRVWALPNSTASSTTCLPRLKLCSWFLPQTLCVCVCVCVLVAHLHPSLCDSMDCNPPGSSVHGIFQVRILEWVSVSFSRGSSWLRDWTHISMSPVLQVDSLSLSHQGSLIWILKGHIST